MRASLQSKFVWALALGLVAAGPSVQAQVVDGDDLQAAIDAAAPGATITVGAGTYDPIVLSQDVVLLGAQSGNNACTRDGTGESVITGAGPLLDLNSGSAGSVIDGFEFSGDATQLQSSTGPIDTVEIRNNRFVGFTGSGIFLNDNGVDITIDQNLIDGTSQAGGGGILHLDQDGFDGMHITNNCISNGATGLFSDGNRNVGVSGTRAPLLSGNLFEGNGTGANIGRKSFEFATISNNNFNDNDFDGLQGGPKGSLIVRNSFTLNGRSGLALTGFGGGGDADRGAQNNLVSQNCFLTNTSEGVFFSASQAAGTISTNRLNQNNIDGNGDGAFYAGGETIDAENNWWGSADGPSGDGPGSGDSVDGASGGGAIDFDPFLTTMAAGTPCTEVAVDHFRCYDVSENDNLPDEIVSLKDQFGAQSNVRVKKTKTLCAPVDKNGEGIGNAETHLTCYDISPRTDPKVDVVVANQFGDQGLRVRRARTLCVPSTKELVGGPPPDDDDDDDDDNDDD